MGEKERKNSAGQNQQEPKEQKRENPNARWYVVHVLTGQEQNVQRYIENTVPEKGLEDKILEVFVPMEEVIEMRGGKRRTVQRKFFPGYVLIRMELDRDTESFIRGVPGVTSFVTSGREPVPLSDEEVESIMQKTRKEKVAQKVEIPFSENDPVRIIDGPFKDFTGIVSEINRERGKVRVMVSIFGRLTPVDVDFMQLKPDKK
ncbi:transcription termination/antitermination factor NusG [bacterium]|nr:transcription termination/antitermination factor NusG [bacterium]